MPAIVTRASRRRAVNAFTAGSSAADDRAQTAEAKFAGLQQAFALAVQRTKDAALQAAEERAARELAEQRARDAEQQLVVKELEVTELMRQAREANTAAIEYWRNVGNDLIFDGVVRSQRCQLSCGWETVGKHASIVATIMDDFGLPAPPTRDKKLPGYLSPQPTAPRKDTHPRDADARPQRGPAHDRHVSQRLSPVTRGGEVSECGDLRVADARRNELVRIRD